MDLHRPSTDPPRTLHGPYLHKMTKHLFIVTLFFD